MKTNEAVFDAAVFREKYMTEPTVPAAWRTEDIARRARTLAEHLVEDNARFNLTAIRDTEGILYRHFVDSLVCASAVAETVPGALRLLDVGSGAGFPALPMALALPQLAVTALDATAKKVAHMEESARRASLSNFRALCGRAEEVGQGKLRASFDAVTARGVAALPVLVELCLPLLRQGGYLFAMKGESVQEEIAASRAALDLVGGEVTAVREYAVPGDARPHAIAVIRKKRDTPRLYPRAYAQILKKPLGV